LEGFILFELVRVPIQKLEVDRFAMIYRTKEIFSNFVGYLIVDQIGGHFLVVLGIQDMIYIVPVNLNQILTVLKCIAIAIGKTTKRNPEGNGKGVAVRGSM
jgi:hypothetical protein